MKTICKVWFVAVLLSSGGLWNPTQAQILVDGVDINELEDVRYISIRSICRFLGQGEVFVLVDYGQWNCLDRSLRPGCYIQGSSPEERRTFPSDMAVVNFFYQQGWELRNTYYEGGGGSDLEVIHLFERRFQSPFDSEYRSETPRQ